MEYIERVTHLFPNWEVETSGLGSQGIKLSNTVSKHAAEENEVADDEKTIFDWCRKGNFDFVIKLVKENSIPFIDFVDPESGMGLIHWGADRGNTEFVRSLIEDLGANIDLIDSEGQTALHYAVSCEHLELTKFLLIKKARTDIADNDGMTVYELEVCDDDITAILKQKIVNF